MSGAAGIDQITFGGDKIYPPFEWVEQGRYHGFNIALEKALAHSGDVAAYHRLGDWPEIIRYLESGEVDVVPMFRSDDREKRFWFSETFYQLHHAMYAGAASDNSPSLIELANEIVAVEEHSFAHQQLGEMEAAPALVLAGNTHEALQLLMRGEASYAILASPTADHLVAKHSMPLKRVGAPLWPREYAFAVRRDRVDVASWVSENLASVMESGEYQRLLDEWSGILWPSHAVSPSESSYWKEAAVLAFNLAAAIVALICLQILRRRHLEPATLLPNRARFIKAADRIKPFLAQLGDAHCVAVKLMGMDELGMRVGDPGRQSVVRELARRLRESSQVAAGALDHETIIFISDGMHSKGVLEHITRPVTVNGAPVKPSVCCGISRWPEQASEIADLVRKADAAMQAALSQGRNLMIYNRSMEPNLKDRQLVRDFEAGKNELFLVYQPQLQLQTGRIIAAEALVRWRHPEFGLVSPLEFVPLLEAAGLSPILTERVVNDAVEYAVCLRSSGLECQISVNVSAYDVIQGDLAGIFSRALERHGGRPHDIKIELTETGTVDHPDRINKALADLRDIGVQSSIDDFGTGYSSLSYVAELPVSELKIDRLFVSQMQRSERHSRIVLSTIALAHELGLSVVAEGVEDEQTIHALTIAGCDRVQGYGVSRPLDQHILLELLRSEALERDSLYRPESQGALVSQTLIRRAQAS